MFNHRCDLIKVITYNFVNVIDFANDMVAYCIIYGIFFRGHWTKMPAVKIYKLNGKIIQKINELLNWIQN